MRSNCMIFAVCFCWGDCYRVSFSRGQRAWRLCPRLLSTAPPSQLGFESEQLENLERPFFFNFSNLITKVWLVRQGKLSNLLWRESFCVETETQTSVGLLHPQAIMWLGRTSRPWRFFLRLGSRSYFFRERTADKIVLLVKCYEAFSKIFQVPLALLGKAHIPTAWLWMSLHTHTPFVFARNFSCNTIMSSKVHSIWTDQDFANAEKVATAADFIFKGIHDKAAKHARCASRECHDDSVSSWKEGVRVSQELKDRGAAWEAARYVGYGFSWVRVTAVTAG